MTVYAGQKADPGQYRDDVRKRVARARRETNSSNSSGSEVEVLRLDGVQLKAGHTYTIWCPVVRQRTNTVGDLIRSRLRQSTTGTATTASDEKQSIAERFATANDDLTRSMGYSYSPASDETLSVLVTVIRASGGGVAFLQASSSQPLELFVDDMGEDPGDTGVVL